MAAIDLEVDYLSHWVSSLQVIGLLSFDILKLTVAMFKCCDFTFCMTVTSHFEVAMVSATTVGVNNSGLASG